MEIILTQHLILYNNDSTYQQSNFQPSYSWFVYFSHIGGLMVDVRSFWEVVLILIAPLMGINDGKLGPIYQELWQRCEG